VIVDSFLWCKHTLAPIIVFIYRVLTVIWRELLWACFYSSNTICEA